jgi:hypothetical protein
VTGAVEINSAEFVIKDGKYHQKSDVAFARKIATFTIDALSADKPALFTLD